MINRINWQLIRKYLEYRLRVEQLCEGSYRIEEVHTRYILEWVAEKSFHAAPTLRPTFPEFLKEFRKDGTRYTMSPVYMKKILATARRFFTWLIDSQSGYKTIKYSWVKTLRVKRLAEIPRQSDAVTLDEILKIASAPVENLLEERIRAAAVFLFLSGVRIGAFVSLPLLAVDIPNRCITQFPNKGVRTKNGKYATTYLLEIPELLIIVQEWDDKVRSLLPPKGLWFAPLSPDNRKIDLSNFVPGEYRSCIARRNLAEWMAKVGLRYHSPHKFRHGHIQYGLARSKTHADYKAVSLNVMHSNIQITDQFYSNIPDSEIKARISAFNQNAPR